MKCPNCDSTYTFPTPETAFEWFCGNCDHVWDDSPSEEED